MQTSLGKTLILRSIAAASTGSGYCTVKGFVKMCQLTRLKLPLMQFMFFSTDLCSPAFFTARITPNQLAACYALLGFAHQGLAPFG
jgi:hypothetical protein